MQKKDYKKLFKDCYSVRKNSIALVDIPAMNYLIVDGEGDPNTSLAYREAIEALFSLSYAIKFKVKKGDMAIDYGVMPLESQWWTDNMKEFSTERKEDWKWSAMIMQPDFVTEGLVQEALEEVAKKKSLPALSKIRFVRRTDGVSAQILHIGPYSEEGPTVEKLHQFIKDNGYELTGKHREIYLSDVRKAAPEKLKTIIRQPVVKR
ncbi:MAG: GyrI-like domain-containing protein [Marinifilaceae bacterium]